MSLITRDQVRESVAVARSHGEKFFEQVVWQVQNETWTILGYPTWDDMRKAEYAGLGVVAPRADRPELVAKLREHGLTQQEIADTVGASRPTVAGDLSSMSKADNESMAEPEAVTNSRGQKRPAKYKRREPEPSPGPAHVDDVRSDEQLYSPKPNAPALTDEPEPQPDQQPAQPKRRPLPDIFWTARYDLGKKAETLHRLIEDNRFPTNRKKVAEANLDDLLRSRDLLHQVIDQLTKA